jgi:hypothetical protein
MVEKQPREINQQANPETVAPLTVTLSETAQRGVFRALRDHLRSATRAEVLGTESRPEMIARYDETRKVTTQIANNLGEEIDPLSALNMGLTDLIPTEQLEQWANVDLTNTHGNITVEDKAKARYFLRKKPPEAKP